MKKLPALLGHVRAFFARPSDQALIDATEDRMVNGPPQTPEQKKLMADLKATIAEIGTHKLQPTMMLMHEDDYNDIVKWSEGSPSGEGQVE